MLRRDVFRTAGALLAGRDFFAGSRYEAEIAEWRQTYNRDLRSEKGPLYLIARHNLPEGRTEIGSDTSSRIALPDRAPKRVGSIERRGDKVTFEPVAGVTVQLNGKPMS